MGALPLEPLSLDGSGRGQGSGSWRDWVGWSRRLFSNPCCMPCFCSVMSLPRQLVLLLCDVTRPQHSIWMDSPAQPSIAQSSPSCPQMSLVVRERTWQGRLWGVLLGHSRPVLGAAVGLRLWFEFTLTYLAFPMLMRSCSMGPALPPAWLTSSPAWGTAPQTEGENLCHGKGL